MRRLGIPNPQRMRLLPWMAAASQNSSGAFATVSMVRMTETSVSKPCFSELESCSDMFAALLETRCCRLPVCSFRIWTPECYQISKLSFVLYPAPLGAEDALD